MGPCFINRPRYAGRTEGVDISQDNKPENTGTSALLPEDSGRIDPVSSEKLSQEEFNFSKLDALLAIIKRDIPNLDCEFSKKKIVKLCLNAKCEKSIRCQDINCSSCGKSTHPLCNSVSLEELTAMMNDPIDKCKTFIKDVFRIEEKLIKEIRQSKKQVLDQFIDKIILKKHEWESKAISEKNINALDGKEASELCKKWQNQWDNRKVHVNNLLQQYSLGIENFVKGINQMKFELFNSFLNDEPKDNNIQDRSKKQTSSLDTQILKLKTQEGQKQLAFLDRSLNHPKKIQLIFRASKYNFKAQAFHNKCDNVQDTLILIRTQFGSTIAGFTHYKWSDVSSGNFLSDKSRKTFLLQMDRREKMVPQQDNNLICSNSEWGPVFGSGDLYISDRCNSNKFSGAFFPSTYNSIMNKHYTPSQKSWKAFSGAQSGYHFKVEEYEVYSVEWNPGCGLNQNLIFDIAALDPTIAPQK